MRFVDTNVLLYASSLPPEDAEKRLRARELLKGSDLAVSVQVLQEFYHQATRPTRPGRLSHEDALRFLQPVLSMQVAPVTLEVFEHAASMHRRFGLSCWDGAILAAARVSGCDVLYSEDMSDTQDYDGLRVVNPFVDIPSGT